MPPYRSGVRMDSRPSAAALRSSATARVEIAVLHLFDVRRDFFIEELARGAGDRVVLFGEIFGSEDFARSLILDQERSTAEVAVMSHMPFRSVRRFRPRPGRRRRTS